MKRTGNLLVLILGLAACATPVQIHTQGKSGTDFSRYRTFAMLPMNTMEAGVDPRLIPRIAGPSRQAVVEVMTRHGLKEVDLTQADLVVHLRGASFPKVDVKNWDYKESVMTPRGAVEVQYSEDVQKYDKRVLIVSLYDTRTKELVWVGEGQRQTSDDIQVERVQAAIREILGRFPKTTVE